MPYPEYDFGDWDDDMGDQGAPGGGVTSGQLAAALVGLAPSTPSFITRIPEAGLSNETALSALATGVLKVTTGTGALSIASGNDFLPHTHTAVQIGTGFLIDGGGAVIATGIKGDMPPMAFAGNITGYAILPDQTGSLAVALWKDSMANYPPVSGDLVLTMTLTAAAKFPASGNFQAITAIPFAVGDVFRFNVNSAATVQRATIGLLLERSI